MKLKIKGPVPLGSAAGADGHSDLVPLIWPPQRPSSGPLVCDTAPLCPAGLGAAAFQQPSGLLSRQPPDQSPSWSQSREDLCTCHTRGTLCPQPDGERGGGCVREVEKLVTKLTSSTNSQLSTAELQTGRASEIINPVNPKAEPGL